ncbi:MAG: acyltransferase family protein [Thermomicrobiales bacterium]
MGRLRATNERILRLFVVNPSSGEPLAYMDGIRAIAVIFVLLVHTWAHAGGPPIAFTLPVVQRRVDLTPFFPYMSVGVDLFFVLSGFLLAQQWLKADYLGAPRPSLRRYFRQRLFRIVPAYYVCLILTLLLLTPGYIPTYLVTGHFGTLSILTHLVFLHYLFPFSAGSFGVDSPFWTLTIEMMFYVTLPWLVRLFLRNRWIIALPAACAVNVAWLVLCRHSLGPLVHYYQTQLNPAQSSEAAMRYILSYQYPGHLLHFALGITLANFFVRRRLGLPTGRLFRALTGSWAGTGYFLAGGVIVLYSMYQLNSSASRLGYVLERYVADPRGWGLYYLHGIPVAIGFTLIIAGVLFGAGWLRTVFSMTPLRLIGVLGYSIYLLHFPVMTVLGSLPGVLSHPPSSRFPILLAATAGVLLVLAGGFYLGIEKPFIVRGRSRATRTPAILTPREFADAASAPSHLVPTPVAEAGATRLFVVPSSLGERVPYLDGLRATAVLFVLAFHTWVLSGTPEIVVTNLFNGEPVRVTQFLATGFVGFDLFFVLGGFLLAQQWLRADALRMPRPSLRDYFRRRFCRIMPAYYVCLFVLLLFLCPYLIPPQFVYSPTGAFILGSHLTFTHFLFPIASTGYGVNSTFGILTTEMIFILVLPLAIRLFVRNRWLVTLPLLALGALGWLSLCRYSLTPLVHAYQGTVARYGADDLAIRNYLTQQFPAYLVNFGLGIVVANLLWQYRTRSGAYRVLQYVTVRWMGTVYFFIGWLVVLYSMNQIAYQATFFARYFRNISVALGFTLILAGLICGSEWLQRVYGIAPLRFIGTIGYSVFLWHLPLVYLFNRYPMIAALPPAQRFPRVLLLTIASSLLLGTLSFLFVEKPFILRGWKRSAASVMAGSGAFDRGESPPILPAPSVTAGAGIAYASPVATEQGFLRSFAIPSSAGSKVPYLDGLRAIAVLFVLVEHAWVLTGTPLVKVWAIQFSPFFKTMFVGVDLFFVLSGFLLSQYWLRADFERRPRPSIRPYILHRVFRIVPAYYVCLIAMLLLLSPYLIRREFVYSGLGAFILGAHLTFTQYLFPLSASDYNINGSMWTLTMEMIFYIVLPWAVILFLRNRWLVTLPVLVFGTLGWLYLCRHSLGPLVRYETSTVARYGVTEAHIRDYLSRQFPAFFVDFGVGIVVANLYWQYKTKAAAYRVLALLSVPWAGTVCFLAGFGIVLYSMNRLAAEAGLISYYLKNIVVAVGFALMLAGLIAGSDRLKAVFSFVPLRFIGIIGYSIFLWHMPLISIFNTYPAIAALPPAQRFPCVLLLATLASLLVGTLSYLLVEKPFIILSRNRPASMRVHLMRTISDAISPRLSEHNPAGE